MAEQPSSNLASVLGFVIWGDLGNLTLYKNKQGKIVIFSKTWPQKPGSEEQLTQRAKMTAAAAAWQALTENARRNWELATRRASLCMHGYDLFVFWTMNGDDAAIRTLERHTATTLLPM